MYPTKEHYKPSNELEMKLNLLEPGKTVLTHIRKVKNGKIELEIAEKIGASGVSALSILNAGDPRFTSRARRGWIIAEASQVEKFFGISASEMAAMPEGGIKEVSIDTPTIAGHQLRLQVVEQTESDLLATLADDNASASRKANAAFLVQNKERSAKRAGANGPVITSGGELVFSSVNVVMAKPGAEVAHNILQSDFSQGITQVMSSPAPFAPSAV
jgi:hypothetical protein